MFKSVKPIRSVQATLSTGTIMTVSHAKSEAGEDAWCADMVASNGETMKFGLSHEAFQAFIGAVTSLYAADNGFKIV